MRATLTLTMLWLKCGQIFYWFYGKECPFIPREAGDQISEEFSAEAWEEEYRTQRKTFWAKLKNQNIYQNTFSCQLTKGLNSHGIDKNFIYTLNYTFCESLIFSGGHIFSQKQKNHKWGGRRWGGGGPGTWQPWWVPEHFSDDKWRHILHALTGH